LSDAAESLINLAAAIFALLILHWVARPSDAEHMYGHEKAECFYLLGEPRTARGSQLVRRHWT
jgi:divalent metal cation (Fe/Co/Zn/Cd) transporter